MAIAFPASPATDQIYTYEGRSWQWNASGWAQVSAQNLLGGGFQVVPYDTYSVLDAAVPYVFTRD